MPEVPFLAREDRGATAGTRRLAGLDEGRPLGAQSLVLGSVAALRRRPSSAIAAASAELAQVTDAGGAAVEAWHVVTSLEEMLGRRRRTARRPMSTTPAVSAGPVPVVRGGHASRPPTRGS